MPRAPTKVLFGEAADGAKTAVADEQDANEETEQDPQGADDAEAQDGAPEDLKVVVVHQGRQGHHRRANSPRRTPISKPSMTLTCPGWPRRSRR